ncbi:MAG: [protein-PII] uridylyltransferase [Rhodospirillaceae bacterium]|nr:[protein-PII] uridylyltransferase [Rhodospirillaceae bacterium]
MKALRQKRKIINRLQLTEAAVELLDLIESERRDALLARYRSVLDSGFAEVHRRFEDDHDGALAVRGNCYLIDQLIRTIYEIAADYIYPAANPTATDQLCIVAYGGYGRGELAPKSDVDLLFVLPYKPTPRSEQIIEHTLYMLWDLGLKVGHATRSIDECLRQAKADITIRTGLLEARYIWGEQKLFLELRHRFWREVAAGSESEYVEAKLNERDERHRKMGDSRYVLEPNIKEGKGGIRDLQTLYWIAKYLYQVDDVGQLVEKGVLTTEEMALFDKAHMHLWSVRCHLHYLTGRPEERLTFDVQPQLAEAMQYLDRGRTRGVERFMKHYFLVAKDVGDLTRIFCAALEARQQRQRRFLAPLFGLLNRDIEGFPVASGWLGIPGPRHFAQNPVDMLRIFEVAQRNGLDIHPDALQAMTRSLRRINKKVRDDPEANQIFLRILTSEKGAESTLRRMNEAGVFGRFIPDFGRVVAQMQYDMYHVYTTDEHTIRAIGMLSEVERGELKDELPVCSEIVHNVLSREILYVAVLLHDIAKGRGGDHSVLGAEVAELLCPRFGFNEAKTETVAWLVRHHLDMSNIAFKRDLDDPKTTIDFVEIVQSPERLRLLLCLTAVDIRAVGPGRWNNWKAALLREIYYRSEAVMKGGFEGERMGDRAAEIREMLFERLTNWTADAVDEHFKRGPASYWLYYSSDTLVRHARFVRQATEAGRPLAIDTEIERELDVTELTVYAADHPGLFNKIAAAIAVCGASIVDARIYTFNNGMALDSFWIQDATGHTIDSQSGLSRIEERIEQSLAGQLRVVDEMTKRRGLPSRTDVFKVPPRVLIDNKASNTFSLIEVNGRDRPGLLYDITRALHDLGLQIASAKISTYGERVVDVFYVKDVFGMKVDHKGKLQQIEKTLLEALCDPLDVEEQALSGAAAE